MITHGRGSHLVINEKAFCWVVSRLARDRPRDAPASHRRIFETEQRRPQPRHRQGLPPDPGLVVMTNLTTRARPQHLQRSRIPSMYVCMSVCLDVWMSVCLDVSMSCLLTQISKSFQLLRSSKRRRTKMVKLSSLRYLEIAQLFYLSSLQDLW